MKNTHLDKISGSITAFRWILLPVLILTHASCFSQQRNGYLGLDRGIYVIKQYDAAAGAHFSGNAELTNDVFLGAEIGFVKFDHLDKVYLPLLARFSFMPQLNLRRANLLILLAPGYGVYDDSYRRNTTYYKSKGGFSFYGGAGAAFRGKGNAYLTLTIGYATFGFTTNGYKSNIDGVGIRIGALFR